MAENIYDREKPILKDDEAMCTACWKVAKKDDRKGWLFMNFNFLQAQEVCPDCQNAKLKDLQKLQDHGL